jgi:hypothetical protein
MLMVCFVSPASEVLPAFPFYHTLIGYGQVQNARFQEKSDASLSCDSDYKQAEAIEFP